MFNLIPLNSETWLICGGRNFEDAVMFENALGDLMRLKGCPCRVVHGGASGADELADKFGYRMGIEVAKTSADWKRWGKAAGPIRNQFMLNEYKPALVIAFPGGRGTADMVARARKAGIDVAEIRSAEA